MATWLVFLFCILTTMAAIGVADAETRRDERRDSQGSPDEPSNRLREIDTRRTEKDAVFSKSPLGWLHKGTGDAKKAIYDAVGLRLATAFAHVFQGLTDAIPGEDQWGTATTFDLIGSWELANRDKPSQGELVAHVQSRWAYGTRGPEELGTFSLGSVIGTADTFSAYPRVFVLRNLYWRQGSTEAGWVYRIGKITPDALLNSSEYLDSQTTFLPSGGTGPFAIALPDSGLGVVGGYYVNDRLMLGALVSDANGDRFNWGDISAGDFFKAFELQAKIVPRTEDAPFSKFTLWHTDGTSDGQASNGSLGPEGWGYFLQHQQELTADGRAIGIFRYGQSFDDSAAYEQQAGVHFLLKEPRIATRLKNDLFGVAFNWAKPPQAGARDEYNVELFYRFPLFPNVDTTLSYQSVINPALTREVDHSSVFSLRLRTAF